GMMGREQDSQSLSHMYPNDKEKKALQGRSYDVSCCSYSAWSQALPQCFVPACSSAIRFIVWHFFLPYSWILHLGSVTSLLTPCHHSHCCSITDLGCGIPECRTPADLSVRPAQLLSGLARRWK
uniref:Uncharacterized protein n=1 Tax=Buteo japonicus TaxID=224669 RepID=A0A8C0BMD5_9AVES